MNIPSILFTYLTAVSATTYFLTVFAPDTNLDGALLNAANRGFYTSIEGPATYCPKNVGKCPDVKGTLVYAGMTGMAVQVPGGQQIFVDPAGHVSYTAAHSASMPPGSFPGGWFTKTVVSPCDPTRDVVDFLSPDNSGAGGVQLCPDIEPTMESSGATYRLYARTKGFNLTDCTEIVGLNLNPVEAEVGCWQYT